MTWLRLSPYVLSDDEDLFGWSGATVLPYEGPPLWIIVNPTEDALYPARVRVWAWGRASEDVVPFGPMALVAGEWQTCAHEYPGVFDSVDEAEQRIAEGP